VHYQQAGCGAPNPRPLDATLIAQAIGEYATARDLATAPGDDETDTLTQMRAHLGRGLAEQCLAENERAQGRLASATTALMQARDEAQTVLDLAAGDEDEQIAHAYYLQGLAWWSDAAVVLAQGHPDAGIAALKDAAAAFDRCKEIGDEHEQTLPGAT